MSTIGSSIPKGMYTDSLPPCNLFNLRSRLGDAGNPTATAFVQDILKTARSVGGLVQSRYFEEREQSDPWKVNQEFFANSSRGTLKESLQRQFCGEDIEEWDINFSEEPCLAVGTGFLIAEDLALTAAHCIFQRPLEGGKDDGFPEVKVGAPDLLVFDYDHPPVMGKKKTLSFPAKNVYKIISVVAYELFREPNKQSRDWAIIKLDRSVTNRPPLKVNFRHSLEIGTNVWMVGHLKGLPKKWRGKSMIMQKESSVTDRHGRRLSCPHFFGANLPAFSGDSGSPVIDKSTGDVFGMLCDGHVDYELKKGVLKESVITEEAIRKNGYEHCLKMSSLTFLEPFFSPKNSLFLQNPSNHKQAEGISLDGKCENTECKSTSPFFIVTANKIDVLKHKIKCQFCNQDMKNKVMVLFNCRYEIKAITKENKKFEGEFLFQRFNQEFGGELRFNLEKWKVLEIRRTDIKFTIYEQIGNHLPSGKTVVCVAFAAVCVVAAPSAVAAALPVLKSAGAATKAVVVASKVKAVCVTAFALALSFSVWYSSPKKFTVNKLK